MTTLTGIVDASVTSMKKCMLFVLNSLQLRLVSYNAALNSLKYKQELALVREQNIDILRILRKLDAFKLAFAKNYNSASTNFGKAIDEISTSPSNAWKVKINS